MEKIAESLGDLPSPDVLACEDILCVDIESTSFNNNKEGLHPFNGDRIAGIGLSTRDGLAWYLPLRHSSPGAVNLPYEETIRWLKRVFSQSRTWVGHNIKFDCRFLHQDGLKLSGVLADTVCLTRLVDPLRFSAKLQVVTRDYLPEKYWKKGDEVKEYLKAASSEDYGTVPIDIMGRYCIQDCQGTLALYYELLRRLPEESSKLWETEKKVTRVLLNSELRGVNVPIKPLKVFSRDLLRKIVPLQDRVNELAGGDLVDVLSNKNLTEVLSKMCVKPNAWTDTGEPSWGAENLRWYGLEITDAIAECKEALSSLSNFGEGWLKRLAPDETLHPNYRQAGTKTGRLSCEDPNFQNLDIYAKMQVVPRKGHAFLSIDYSQIEFRLFAHYTNSQALISKYNDDPKTDFHQMLADMLGIPRKPAKTLNFGMIYGMGRDKLVAAMLAFIHSALKGLDDEKTRPASEKILLALRSFNYGEEVTDKNARHVASCVYISVHRRLPEIKDFQRRVENKVKACGRVAGAFGRVYTVPPEWAHKARNYIVQGSAADLLKDRLADIEEVLEEFMAYLLGNVHDEVLVEVPVENIMPLANRLIPYLENPSVKFRVPIRVEPSVCLERWGVKIPLEEYARTCGILN